MADTHVSGTIFYLPGYWGAARPCRRVTVEILDKDLGNPDDVLWRGTTDDNGRFTADSDARWRDQVDVQVPIPRWPFHETRQVDDPTDVKALLVRVTEGNNRHTVAPALSPAGDLLVPVVVPWGFPGPVALPITGVVLHAFPPGTPARFAQVRIEDLDADGSLDRVCDLMTDLDGRFSGTSFDVRGWLEAPGDVPTLSITVTQGLQRQTFPLAMLPDRIAPPPVVVPWGPAAIASTPCNDPAPVRAMRAAEVDARRLVTAWAFGDTAGCADPIPPWTVPTPRHTTEFAATTASSQARAAGVRTVQWPSDPFDNLDDYRKFFPHFDAPSVLAQYPGPADVVISDQAFADQRLAGPNPLMLRKVRTASDLPAAFGGGFAALRATCAAVADLNRLLQDRTLYLVDYEILGDPPLTAGGKYMPCPFALFGILQGRLAPIAIQIERHFDATTNPVFLPGTADPTMWNLAKVMVQIADMNAHELQAHLHDTHLAMEPFAVALDRTMSSVHPISILLQPHFMGMIAKNSQARNYLMSPVGPLPRVLGVTLAGAHAVVQRAAQRWSFPAQALPRFLADRGLDDVTTLPEYPYRDDGMVIWKAIAAFVSDYVGHTYATDAQITGCDTELQRWLTEVRASNGGRLASVPAVSTRADLAAVLTQVIFTCSAQHSAVNFAQWDYMAFVPNMPGSAYARPLPSAQGPGETRLARVLPGADAALDQTSLMWTLAHYRYDKLGGYETTFYEPWATDVRTFQDRLVVIEKDLVTTDKLRRIKYRYLRPSRIINSINV